MSITRIVRMFCTGNNTIVKALVYSAVCVIGAALLVSCSATGAGDANLGAITGDPGPVTGGPVTGAVDLPLITLSSSNPTIDVGTDVVIMVAAASAPSEDVTITVTATQDGAEVGTPRSVTLTKGEYSQPATFTGLTAGLHIFSAIVAPSGIMNPTIESLEITMNDPAQPGSNLEYVEHDDRCGYRCSHNGSRSLGAIGDVTIEVTATQGGLPVGTPRSVTLTNSEYSMPATFTGLTAGLHTITATAAPSGIVQPTIASLDITVSDPNQPVVTLSTSSLTISEGDEAVITVAAVSAPLEDVTITVTVTQGGLPVGTPRSVTLTKSEYSMQATFTGLTAGLHTFTATAAPSGIVNSTIESLKITVSDPAQPVVILSSSSPTIDVKVTDAVITVSLSRSGAIRGCDYRGNGDTRRVATVGTPQSVTPDEQ